MNSRRCFTCNQPSHLARDHQEWEEKNGIKPLQSKGPTPNRAALEKAQTKTLSARMARASHGVEGVPYLNPDAFSRFISSKNWGQL